MQFKSFMEALKGKQHKIDKNKNGEIDAHDFKLLRKEETEELEEAKMSDAEVAEKERIVKGMKKNLAGFKAKYGERAKEVMYATATKQAMKEETVEEAVQKADVPAYLRKQQGQTPLKLSDLKRKDTISDKENLAKLRNEESELEEATKYVVHYTNDKGEHVNSSKAFDDKAKADAHASKGNAMDKVGGKYTVKTMQNEQKQDVPFEGPYTKTKPAKNSDGTTQSPMSRARELAKQAMKKQMKEHFNIEMTDEQADSILDYIDEQAPVAPVPDKKYIKGTPENKAYKATKKPINGMPTNKMSCEETALDEVESKTVSYGDFISNLLEYETKDGRYVHKGTYGGSYVDPEGADDADDKKPKQQPAEKRGRGRPAGAKSGARKITGTSKLFK